MRALAVRFHKEAEKLVVLADRARKPCRCGEIRFGRRPHRSSVGNFASGADGQAFPAGPRRGSRSCSSRACGTSAPGSSSLKHQNRSVSRTGRIFSSAPSRTSRAFQCAVGDRMIDVRARVDAIRIHPERPWKSWTTSSARATSRKPILFNSPSMHICCPLAARVRILRHARILSAGIQRGSRIAGRLGGHFRWDGDAGAARDVSVAPGGCIAIAGSGRGAAPPRHTGRAAVEAFRGFNLGVVSGVIEGPQVVRLAADAGAQV